MRSIRSDLCNKGHWADVTVGVETGLLNNQFSRPVVSLFDRADTYLQSPLTSGSAMIYLSSLCISAPD